MQIRPLIDPYALQIDGTNRPTANINWGGFNLSNVGTIASGAITATVANGIQLTLVDGAHNVTFSIDTNNGILSLSVPGSSFFIDKKIVVSASGSKFGETFSTGDVNAIISNLHPNSSAASASLLFRGGLGRTAGKIVSNRISNYDSDANADSTLDFYRSINGTDVIGLSIGQAGVAFQGLPIVGIGSILGSGATIDIGPIGDTDLLRLANNALTINGTVSIDGDITIASGSIKSDSGTIDFDNEILVTIKNMDADFYSLNGTKSFASSGTRNLQIGELAGNNNVGVDNVFIGFEAGKNNDTTGAGNEGEFNVYIGTKSGTGDSGTNNTGFFNVGLGADTLRKNTSGTRNLAMGAFALSNNGVGNDNTVIGAFAASLNTDGVQNVIIGTGTKQSGTGDSGNTAIGYYSMQAGSGSSRNTAIGYRTLRNISTGDDNVAIGYNTADIAAMTASFAIIIGSGVDPASASINYQINIGNVIQGNWDTGANAGLNFKATGSGVLTFGDGGATDYSEFEADGTYKMNGAATVFNDIVISLSSARVPASNAPTWAGFIGNLNAYTYGVNDFQEFSTELAHSYKGGATIEFHIHGAVNGSDVDDRTIKFEIEYTIADVQPESGFGDVYPNTITINAELTIPASTTDLTAFTVDIGDDTSGAFVQGAIVKGRIRRIASSGTEPSADPFLTEVGIHIESDTIGTRTATSK